MLSKIVSFLWSKKKNIKLGPLSTYILFFYIYIYNTIFFLILSYVYSFLIWNVKLTSLITETGSRQDLDVIALQVPFSSLS